MALPGLAVPLSLLFLTAAASLAAEPSTGPQAESPIATWRGGEVYRHQLDGWLRFQRRDGEPEDLRSEIEDMLWVETLAGAAEKRGGDRRPAFLAAFGQAREEALLTALRRFREERVTVSDEEVRAYLRDHPDLRHRPRKVRLRNLYKRFPESAGEAEKDALRARMREIRAALVAGGDFAELARAESDSQTRFRKGILGNLAAGQLRPEIDAVAMKLEPGELSAVLETPDGLTLLRCDQIFEAYVPAPAEQREAAAVTLLRQKVRADWEAFVAGLLSTAGANLDPRAARDPAAGEETVVARFEGGRATRGELAAALRSPAPRRTAADLDDEALKKALERLVVQKLGAERARREGLDRDPGLLQQLAWQRRQLLAGEELGRRVQAELEPLEEKEIRAFFEARPGEFQRLPHYDLELIRISLVPGEERRRYQRAAEIAARIASGALDFAAAARAHSDHPSAARGGVLGWLSRRQVSKFGASVLKTVSALAPGEISRLVQQDQRLYVLRLRGRQEARPLTWEEAAELAEQKLGGERVREIQERLEKRLRAELEVRLLDS